MRCLDVFRAQIEPGKCGGGNETVETVLARVCDGEVCVFDGEKGVRRGVHFGPEWVDKDG